MDINEKTLQITCQGAFTVEIDELNELHHFKALTDEDYAKCRNSLTDPDIGFTFPLSIWTDGEGKKWTVDGHQRIRAIKRMKEEGYIIPPLPASIVFAPNKQKAAKKIVASDSKYGDIVDTEFVQFLNDYQITFEEIEPFMDIQGITDELWTGVDEIKEDEAPPVSQDPAKSQLGEVYQLGRHRLMCGDSTKIEDVEKLMNGQKAELLFTSPPYSDQREYNGDKDLSTEKLSQFIPTYRMFVNYQVVNLGMQRKNDEVYPYWNDYIETAKNAGLKLLSWNIWNRDMAGFIGQQTAMFAIYHEWLFVFGENKKILNRTVPHSESSEERRQYKPSTKRLPSGELVSNNNTVHHDFKQLGTVINLRMANTIGESDHPAMFPVSLPYEYIQAMTNENDNVIDCFGGSGTTLIAAEQLNRTAYLMELDPKYCDVIRKRYAKLINKEEEWETLTPAIS